MSQIRTILAKDLKLERTGSGRLVSAVFFSTLLTIIASVAVDLERFPMTFPGVFWLIAVFTGTFLVHGSLANERRTDQIAMLLLRGVSPEIIWCAKTIFNWLSSTGLIVVMLGLFAVFFRIDLQTIFLPMMTLIALFCVGFCSLGTLLSAMLGGSKLEQLLFPVVFYPLILPLVIPAIYATGRLMDGQSMDAIHYLVAFDLFAVAAGLLFASAVLEE